MLQPSQSELLCEGIQRVYGDTYPIEAFYDANYLRTSMEAGLLHCVAALDAQERVQGCMSTVLECEGAITADGSALLVAPEYRSQGVVAKLGHYMADTYQRLGLRGLHLYALGLHDRVQKQSGAAGAVVTGILPAWFSRKAKAAGYDFPDARIGAVTLLMPLSELPKRRVFLPSRYEAILGSLYGSFPFERECVPAVAQVPPASYTVLQCDTGALNLQRRLTVQQVGRDLEVILSMQLEQSAANDEEVVYLDIPLCEPLAEYAAQCANRLGFFFGAIMIERDSTDRLRLQRYVKKLAAPEHMVVASMEAQELLAFVLSDQETGAADLT